MNTNRDLSYLNQFSWEEWDNQMIAVLYRSERRVVVKRYLERVLANSPRWQQLAHASFALVAPPPKTFFINENEIKLMRHVLSWHLKGTLVCSNISTLDQLLDWEDVLDFIDRAQRVAKNDKNPKPKPTNLSFVIPIIPIGMPSTKTPTKRRLEHSRTSENAENVEPKETRMKPVKTQKKDPEVFHEKLLPSSSNSWVQINNVCVPFIVKSAESHFVPYQVLLDCDLLNDDEQSFLCRFTIKATADDIQTFKKITSFVASLDFTLNNDLLLIDLYDLLFGMSKVAYVKLLNNHQDVNRRYKTVLAQRGGTAFIRSHRIPYINLRKNDYVLLSSLIKVVQPTKNVASILRRQALDAHSHEVDYLRLIELYQQKSSRSRTVVSQQQDQLIVNVNEIQKCVPDCDVVIDASLAQLQQNEQQKLRKQMETINNKSTRRLTRHDTAGKMIEIQNTTMGQ